MKEKAAIGFSDDLSDLFMLGSIFREGMELAAERRLVERTGHEYGEASALSDQLFELMSNRTGTIRSRERRSILSLC